MTDEHLAPRWAPPQVPPPPPAAGFDAAAPDGHRRRPVVSRAARRWWLAIGGLLAVASVGYGVLTLVQLVAHQQVVERTTHDAAGLRALVVDHDNGSVRIVGGDVDRVSVTADISRGLTATQHSIEELDGELVIHDNCPQFQSFWCVVDYEITVPRGLPLRIASDNGTVTISNIDADVIVDTDNGRMELELIAGTVRLASDNGNIVGHALDAETIIAETRNGRIELEVTTAPSSVIASSRNGRIELTLPDVDGGYAVNASTDNGRITVGVVDNPRSSRVVSATSRNGSVTVRPPSVAAQ